MKTLLYIYDIYIYVIISLLPYYYYYCPYTLHIIIHIILPYYYAYIHMTHDPPRCPFIMSPRSSPDQRAYDIAENDELEINETRRFHPWLFDMPTFVHATLAIIVHKMLILLLLCLICSIHITYYYYYYIYIIMRYYELLWCYIYYIHIIIHIFCY